MKKSHIVTLLIGSAAVAAGAAAFVAAKFAGNEEQPKHDPKDQQDQPDQSDQIMDTPYVPEDDGISGTEDVSEEAEGFDGEPEEPGAHDAPAEAETEDTEEKEQGPSNLEEYIELNPEERTNLESVQDGFAAEGVKTDITFADNTMFFDFVMTDVDDDETKEILKPDLEKFLDDQEETYRDIVRQIEEDTGIEGIKMIVIFMDENEAEIVSGHYDSSGRTM